MDRRGLDDNTMWTLMRVLRHRDEHSAVVAEAIAGKQHVAGTADSSVLVDSAAAAADTDAEAAVVVVPQRRVGTVAVADHRQIVNTSRKMRCGIRCMPVQRGCKQLPFRWQCSAMRLTGKPIKIRC